MNRTHVFRCVLLVAFLGCGCRGLGEDTKPADARGAGRIVGTLPLDTNRSRISLDGQWGLRYDPGHTLPNTKSFAEKWYRQEVKFPEVTQVPGCWHYKTGKPCDRYGSVTWFKKTFRIPADWKSGRVWLNIGGVKPSADIWLNDAHLGFTLTSRSPIKMDVTDLARFGEENTLALCVSYPDVRLDGVWDWGDQCWDGIYRSVFLEQTPGVWLDDVHVQTDLAKPSARVNLVIKGGNRDAAARSAKCRITPWQGNGPAYTGEVQIGQSTKADTICASAVVDMSGARLWSPDQPNLYVAQVSLLGEQGNVIDEASVRFGLREISRKGKQVLLNGRPIFLRGGCDDQLYPESFCPPNSKEFYLRRIKLAKEYGFNYTKSCAEVFTPEYLDAADEAGYLVCEEMPFGLEARRNIRYNPPPKYEKLYREQLAHIILSDRNHPSVAIYSMCSEIWEFSPIIFRVWGQDLPRLARRLNPSALIFDCTGGFPPEVVTKFGKRITDLESRFNQAFPCNELPYIFHEWHWITALPNLQVKARYHDLPIKPNGVLEMEAAAAKTGLTGELPQMVAASQKLKYVLRKSALEHARKTPGTAGYHHWLIHDINWCPEGVFNEFWEAPNDLSAAEFRTYNADTVVLLKNAPSIYENNKACYFGGEELDSPILVSHYGTQPLAAVDLDWKVTCGGKTVLEGHQPAHEIACGSCTPVVTIKGRLPVVEKAGTFTIEAFLRKSDGSEINRNKWRFWVFPTAVPDFRGKRVTTTLAYIKNVFPGVGAFDPARKPQATDLLVADTLTENVTRHLEGGGRVLLLNYRWREDLPDINRLAAEGKGFSRCGLPDAGARCTQFRTIPYNSGKAGNMGTVISDHPALAEFPHEGWCDMQFYRMIQDLAAPFDLAALRPAKIKPIIRSIGSYQRMQDKGYIFEAAVGPGKLMASSLALAPADHPERRFLVGLLLKHCSSDRFAPRDKLPPEILRKYVQAENKPR
jgi:beta-galactosidase